MHRIRRVLIAALVVILLGGASFILWASSALGPEAEALDALVSDTRVQVTTDNWITFVPRQASTSTGVIIYPGGRVDPRAYAPLARALAVHGYTVFITPMPLNLAVFSPGKAEQVINAHPEIQNWVIAGHSLGGAMGANFARRHPEQIMGLVLLAAYPATSDDLAQARILVASIYASLDGLATPEKIDASRTLLPPDTLWSLIEGGNHAQFGYYGPQAGDNPAEISRAEQQKQMLNAMLHLLMRIEIPVPTRESNPTGFLSSP
jgi:pimeloyl-ACP methyl ester carboxylesterase